MGLITTAEIIRIVDDLRVKYRNPSAKAYIRNVKITQRASEESLKKIRICSPGDMERVKNTIGSLDGDNVTAMIEKNFMDVDVMRAMQCVVEALASGSINDIRMFFSLDKAIGAESAFGYAILSDIQSAMHASIIKAPRVESDLFHEYIVGVFGLNRLREQIPNYAYIYGFFSCSAPQLNEDNTVASYCNSNVNAVTYVAYENIVPSVTMNLMNRTWSFGRFMRSYMQILYAGIMAYEACGFTHYDLHDQNVLIRRIPNVRAITYKVGNSNVYLDTDEVATVIDYGQSYINYDGRSYGYTGLEASGVSAEDGFPLFDAYKLLLMSMNTMRRAGNRQCLAGCARLLKFFNSQDSAETILDMEWGNRYSLPRTLRDVPLIEFIRYCDRIHDTVTLRRNARPLRCTADECDSVSNSLQYFGLTSITTDLAPEFITVYRSLNTDKERRELRDNFKAKFNLREALDEVTIYLKNISSISRKYTGIPVDLDRITSMRYLSEYQDRFAGFTGAIKYYQGLVDMSNSLSMISKLDPTIVPRRIATEASRITRSTQDVVKRHFSGYIQSYRIIHRLPVIRSNWLNTEFIKSVESYADALTLPVLDLEVGF